MSQAQERARGFPAFAASKRHRAQSWWGKAWVQAMEDTALDTTLLTKGRTYAKSGHVGTITVSPGRIAASVHGVEDVPHRTVVYLEPLSDDEWARFLNQVAAKAGHIAALLDRDMPHDLVDAASDAGVPLLPDIGDLDTECSCPDWGHPCKHAAALCYQAAWLLDQDPFVLLLVRGRGEREVLDALQRRNLAQGEVEAESVSEGTPARRAYNESPAPLPELPELPESTDPVALVESAPGIDPAALQRLVVDAAARARALLATRDGGELATDLNEWQDTVRLAATYPDSVLWERLQHANASADLAGAARAWEFGGVEGLAVWETPWDPPELDVLRAQSAWADAWDGDDLPELERWRNWWTLDDGGRQLRYGRDGRWYPYRDASGGWTPAGPPDRDPVAALAAVLSE